MPVLCWEMPSHCSCAEGHSGDARCACLLDFFGLMCFGLWLAAGWLGFLALWLAGWLAGWLVGWLAGWLAGWLVGWLVGWFGEDEGVRHGQHYLTNTATLIWTPFLGVALQRAATQM